MTSARTRSSAAGYTLQAHRPSGSAPDTMTFPELFALPVTVDLATAARALGISMTTAYRLTQRNAFPCAIMRPTFRYRIPTASLLTALDIGLQPVHPDDVENGIDFARRFART